MEITILSCGGWILLSIETAAGRKSWLIQRAAPPPAAPAPSRAMTTKPIKPTSDADPWDEMLRALLGGR
ncbi:hypothetical protein PRJ39_25050 [Lysobacter enzymogenes]|uniref:hypothetical protein n=1 Tax=Lysobacter enzymogenes TaxID=69 RepID=UPI003748CA78